MNVEDANDHSPYFTNPLYEASVFESAALGSAVLQVTALDKDKGENAELMYTIEAGESCCRQQHHAWHWTLSSIYHHVKFSELPLACLQMDFLGKQLPYLFSDGVLSSWHFSNMFSIIDSKERVSFYCVQSQIFLEWRREKTA